MNNEGTDLQRPEKVNAFAGVAQMFYEPTAFFTKLKNDPKILVPYILLVLVSFGLVFLLKDLIIDMQLQNPQVLEQFPDGNVPDSVRGIMGITTTIGGTIAISILPLLGALLSWFWGNFVFGGKQKYSALLSVWLYAELLYMIGGLLIVPMVLAKGSLAVTLSPAVLVAEQGVESIAFVILSKFSLFHIWEIVVLGIGLSVFYDFPRNKGYILSVLSLGLLMGLHVIMSIIGIMMA